MTEREYVDHLNSAAQNYIIVLAKHHAGENDNEILDHWEAVKTSLSPFSAIELCDAWLAKESMSQISDNSEISNLRARIKELEEALEPFARNVGQAFSLTKVNIRASHIARARQVYH